MICKKFNSVNTVQTKAQSGFELVICSSQLQAGQFNHRVMIIFQGKNPNEVRILSGKQINNLLNHKF